MNQVITWLKGNVFIVVCFVVMVAALVAFPMVAGRMNTSIKSDLQARGQKNTKLESLKRTNVQIGAETLQTLPNPKLLADYQSYWNMHSEDARRVRDKALEFNSKGRGLLVPELFPQPRPEQREVLPRIFHDQLMAAYDALLKKVEAGTPPSPDELAERIERAAANFRINDLKRAEGDSLTADEEARLKQELSMVRLAQYVEQAERINFYCTRENLNLPSWVQTNWALAELFQWQWQFWIVQDLLEAMAAANSGAPSVVQGPVKRVVSISAPSEMGGISKSGSGSAGGGGGPEGGPEGGMTVARGRGGSPMGEQGGDGGVGGAGATDSQTPLGPVAVNWASPVQMDYSVSFTGRKSNEIYDVRFVEMQIVVETASIPIVMDELARRNFITVLDLTIAPADNFAAAREGFYYGDVPCSELRLVLETVWLREWTGQYMPPDLRRSLGIRSQPIAASAESR